MAKLGDFSLYYSVKQGDPLSPALFILTAEVLSRALNFLFDDRLFVGYGLPKWSAQINHLAYAYDTIIFSSADTYFLKMIVAILQDYKAQSGQKVNKEKSFFFIHQMTASELRNMVEECTGISKAEFPFKYLGCPITHARKRKEHYADLIKKMGDKLQA